MKCVAITGLLLTSAMMTHAADTAPVQIQASFEQKSQTQPASVKVPDAAPVALSTDGKPGDVRLVVCATTVISRKRGWLPKIGVPPFKGWNKWLDEHEKNSSHSTIDWMDDEGKWWHTELQELKICDPQYVVGTGEFPATGLSVYGILVQPGRSNPDGQKVLYDELQNCDYHDIEREARNYARKDRGHGDPGSNGNGKENVGLGGPAYKPAQNSNTFVSYVLKRSGVKRAAPEGAVGWDTEPHFPYSADAE